MARRWERARVEHAIERGDSIVEGFGVWGMGLGMGMEVRFGSERRVEKQFVEEGVPGRRRRRRRKHIGT